jgi:hypothetical protein
MRSVLLALAVAALPTLSPVAVPSRERPRVEVAFVLDTTGSMGGLIEGAKRRIWTIARRIGEGRPRPDLRVALVAYRDLGDSYVTRVFDLTDDLDDVYGQLMSLQAEGGGDTPEHVSRALSDAVHGISWSRGSALRVVFLVGDAPPHLDYQDGFDYRRHVREARQRGILVDAIQCGGDPQAQAVWREVATLGAGHYAQIDGQGGMPVRVTPVDGELARLNSELASTVVAGGSVAEQRATDRKLRARAAMSAPVAAEAAGYYAAADKLVERDLVDLSVEEQKKAVADAAAKPSAAPPALRGRTAEEGLAVLARQKEHRAALQARIQTLQKQREDHLAKTEAPVADAFDEQVVQWLRERAAVRGIRY